MPREGQRTINQPVLQPASLCSHKMKNKDTAKMPGPALVGHDQSAVLVDGRPQKPDDTVFTASLTFSPDGSHLAYLARARFKNGVRDVVVVDDKEGEPFSGMVLPAMKTPLVFDASNRLHYLLH